MPNLQQKVTNTFIKGLITEAGELTFPENASIDELNCELFRDGSRRRRKGITIEDSNTLSTFTVNESTTVAVGEWENVGNNASKTYLALQSGTRLYFYNKGQFPYSGQRVSGSINLLNYEIAGSTGVAFSECQFASILGALVVVNKSMKPLYVEETDSGFSVTVLDCEIRDLEWMTCKDGYDKGVPTDEVTSQRKYDTANSGWAGDLGLAALGAYIASQGEYPPLTHPWFSGKDADGDFSVTEWLKVYSGTSLIGNGHFILDLFNRDRNDAFSYSGTGAPGEDLGLEVEVEQSRFTTVAAFSNRVFFSGLTSSKNTGKIYYSQTLQNLCDMGNFYQQNDPTSEEISDLLETDGGYIAIPDAREIKRLYAFRNSLFIFAENGVWQVKGVDDVFSPTAYSVSRITELGIASPTSFTPAEGVPFWWSRHGIHTLSFDEFGTASEQNLSISTVQTFWNAIDSTAKDTVRATYDRVNKKILWLYKNNAEPIANKYNKVLILDVTLQAFYPWTFVDKGEDTDYVLGFAFYTGYGAGDVVLNVISADDEVVVGSDDVVSTQETPLSQAGISVVFIIRDTSETKLTMGLVNEDTFYDWGTENYVSYAVTGYDFFDSLIVKKTAPYLVFYSRETETGWVLQDDGSYLPDNPSSLYVSCYWDFKKLPSSIPQQVYRRRQPIIVDETDLDSFGSPSTVLTSRIRVRGRGTSLRVKLESEEGKDFIYLGHGTVTDASARF